METPRFPQPITVKVIGCALLVYAGFGAGILLNAFFGNGAWRDDPTLLTGAALLAATFSVSGSFMLRGENWARLFYFGACVPVHLFLVACVGGSFLMMGIAPALVVGICLITESANRFFTGEPTFFRSEPTAARLSEPERKGRYDY